jgi:hypothetical protein
MRSRETTLPEIESNADLAIGCRPKHFRAQKGQYPGGDRDEGSSIYACIEYATYISICMHTSIACLHLVDCFESHTPYAHNAPNVTLSPCPIPVATDFPAGMTNHKFEPDERPKIEAECRRSVASTQRTPHVYCQPRMWGGHATDNNCV